MPTRTAVRDPFVAQLSDDDLVEQARRIGNDNGALEELYRRHESGARNVARHILRSRQDADDVVSEAFAGVISAIANGAGPRTNFRQYLMACVRNSCKSRRWSGGAISTDPSIMEQNGVCFEDPDRLSEQGLVASAFSSLSADWQLTLWLTAVEERPTSEVAEQLGRRPGAVAALAHRAREAFAEAYLAQHQARNTSPACAKIAPKLAHYVRGHSGDVDTVLVERHLGNCVPCSCSVDELRDLNASLRTLTGPAPMLGSGLAAAGTGAALLGGFMPIATAGGWSLGAIGGVTLAKVAVIGALMVPAAAMVVSDQSSSTTGGSSGAAAPALATNVGGPAVSPRTAISEQLPSAAEADVGAPTPGAEAPVHGGFVPTGTGTGTSTNGLPLHGIDSPFAGDPVGEGATGATSLPTVVTTVTGGTMPPITVRTPSSGSNTAGVDVGVGQTGAAATVAVPVYDGGAVIELNTGVTGIDVGVAATLPVAPFQAAVTVSVPPLGGGLTTPSMSVNATALSPISTPATSLPGGSTVLASITVPAAVVVPSIPVAVVVPSLDVPTVVSNVVTPILQVLLGNH